MPALRWQRVTYPLTRNFPVPEPSRMLSGEEDLRRVAPQRRRARLRRHRRGLRERPQGRPFQGRQEEAKRRVSRDGNGASRLGFQSRRFGVRSRALGQTREPRHEAGRCQRDESFSSLPRRSVIAERASRARFDATRERLALSSRKSKNRENCVLRFMRGILVQVRQSSKHNATAGGCGADARGAFLGHRPSVSSPHRRAKTRTQRMCREGRCPSRAPSTPPGDSRRPPPPRLRRHPVARKGRCCRSHRYAAPVRMGSFPPLEPASPWAGST